MSSLYTYILRLLLVVLISTFMSPSFAWQMIDSHNETTIASLAGNDDHHHHEDDLYHHHHHDEDGDGDDDTAHSQIGHLLSHLPAVMHNIVLLATPQTNSTTFPVLLHVFTFTATDPPFKPPRDFLFV